MIDLAQVLQRRADGDAEQGAQFGVGDDRGQRGAGMVDRVAAVGQQFVE